MRSIFGFMKSLVQPGRRISTRTSLLVLLLAGIVVLAAGGGSAPETAAGGGPSAERFWGLLKPVLEYPMMEKISLFVVLGIAVLGLLYAGLLVKQVLRADQGTPRMQEIARAVREGANAYLAAQFRKIGPLIVVITVALFCTKWGEWPFACGRAGAFLAGSSV